ncbi:hypothetical protein [Streptomyces sp. NPDC001678]|uniref:hypothetical protein n=1 Tax=Streptomyces sp. NPDC001678 TaxID=3364599 RepID=UPI00367C66C0
MAKRFGQRSATAPGDRDVVLRMLDRISRIALDVIKGTNSEFTKGGKKNPQVARSAKKITPHLAVALMPDGSLAISGNTGEKKVTDNDKTVVEREIKKFVESGAEPYGAHSKPKDRNKLGALVSGDYAAGHAEASALRTIADALEKPIGWLVAQRADKDEKEGVSQHGEMTLLGRLVEHWRENPGDPGRPQEVMLGGVKKACLACQWAFEAVDEHIGKPLGYKVVVAGTHGQYFPGWRMPNWITDENPKYKDQNEVVRKSIEDKARGTEGVEVDGDKLQGSMSEMKNGHDPDASASEWEEEG